jgi:hypothetical protein
VATPTRQALLVRTRRSVRGLLRPVMFVTNP